ncbi:matrix-remodeling-associated protein 7 [Bactrocera oleae]|uniref:matrix-remodeling-associated protein 7 n=1 Tax=Bactrocera oleae TaxID=104688 RepID=UPI0006B722A0|nr:matrix-remodeling-associated protein 7 [Bactrocera oleae]XP_036216439.1 matrix-remodeling-associated protein 7 [Bactrocera oleae]
MNGLLGITEIFDSLDNVYLLSTVTMLAAVILAFYFSNLVKDIGLYGARSDREVEEQPNLLAADSDLYECSDEEEVDTDNPLGDGLVGKIKSARLKELEAQLTHDQLEEERKIEREQLTAIFELLKKQEADLNTKEIDERELVAQLNLYR